MIFSVPSRPELLLKIGRSSESYPSSRPPVDISQIGVRNSIPRASTGFPSGDVCLPSVSYRGVP